MGSAASFVSLNINGGTGGKMSRKMPALDDIYGPVRDCVDFKAKTPATKRLVVLALGFSLAFSLVLLGGIAGPVDAQSSAQRLPDLRMASFQDLKIREYADGRRLLRFTAIIVNVGAGPFEVHGQRPNTGTSNMAVTQRIYNDAGGYRDVPTPATMFFSGDGPDHWHVKHLQRYTLRRLYGWESGPVRVGAKDGFCFYDVYLWNGILRGAPESKEYRENSSCGEAEEQEALQVEMGLSVGWSDVYTYMLPLQYIDITGLPSGRYRLYAIADAREEFRESREANNYTWFDIELKGNKVRVLKDGPSAPYCGRTGRYC